jgi:putative Mg2+ transporter-C (MgtC) family protein
MPALSDNQIVLRLVLAMLLGGLIGVERQLHRRTAGLRTNILVCVGSCLITLVSMHMFELYRSTVTLDPTRIAANIVTGIGFLGAGAIMREPERVKGLTTAACLWVVAAIGLAVGCGFYSAALTTTALTLIVLFFLRYIESAFFDKYTIYDKGGDE